MHTVQLTILDFMPPEKKCLEDLRATRWSEGVTCPICNSKEIKKNGTENGKQKYYCHGHGETFRDTTNTIFYYSKLALSYWYYFIFHYLQNASANHLKEVLGISYKTALRMARKIQSVLTGKSNEIKLKGDVEFDELYLSCGEKGETNLEREPRKRGLKLRGRGTIDEDKPPIIGACDRKGNLRLKVSDHADSNSICVFLLCIMASISDLFKVFTDDFTAYRFLDKTWIPHETVNHPVITRSEDSPLPGASVTGSRLGVKRTYKLIDTHVHLVEIENLEQVLARAKQAGVVAVVAVGSDLETNKRTLKLAELYKNFVYPALGFHPWNISEAEVDTNLEFIESHVDEAVAIGEVGLDYHKKVRARADKDLQKSVLRAVLQIAKTHQKPALMHSRYAWRDSLDMVEEAQLEKAVFHWYTGTSSVLRDIVNQGYFISATPAVEYHEEHRRAVKEIPLERLLLETDAPVVYQRGNEFEYESRPADVVRSLRGSAALKGVSEAEVAEVTTANAIRFYGL